MSDITPRERSIVNRYTLAMAGLVVLLIAIFVHLAHAQEQISPQQGRDPVSLQKQLTRLGTVLEYMPPDLGLNAVALGNAATITVPTVPINLSEAYAFTFSLNCGQITNVTVVPYGDTQGTRDVGTALSPAAGFTLATNLPANQGQMYIGTELAPGASGGTAGTFFRLPQRAVQFKITNTTATPTTCTGWLFVKY